MSVCPECKKVAELPNNFTNLEIGTISNFNQSLRLYVKDIGDNRQEIRDTAIVSGVAGLIVVSAWDIALMEGITYELWVTKIDAKDIEDRLDLTIAGDVNTHACVAFRTKTLYDEDGDVQTIADVKFRIKS